MNLLRATVKQTDSLWELALLDLDVVAEGDSEDSMLRDLEHTLAAEYHVALNLGKTPFLDLMSDDCPEEVRRSWEDGGKKFRVLNLRPEVRAALAAAFRSPKIEGFQPCTTGHTAA